ncbi:MAG: hypothetical protein WDN45_01655, partial [Caulobacteraceae bacterium]
MGAKVRPNDLPKTFPVSTVASTAATALLCLYCGGAFAMSLLRHVEWMSVSLTGMGTVMFAVMTALNVRGLREERRAQSEYSLTASRHSSKPVRSP